VLELARGVITNSQATLDELVAFAARYQKKLPPATAAFLSPPSHFCANPVRPVDRPYFVVLGTIESRKNHLLLLQVWKLLIEQLGEQTPLLVVIGQRGWECENVVDLLERCEQLKGHFIELPACSDADIATWLTHAQALLFPSFTEGFGLPLVEALACHTPVITSKLKVFQEIAGTIPEYLDPIDGLGWLAMIKEYSEPGSGKRRDQLERMASFVVPTWNDHFKNVDLLLEQVTR